MPAYVEALLERTADGLDELARTLRRTEESREATVSASATLVERLASLAETMRGQQTLLARMAEQSIELRTAINRLAERFSEGDREALVVHQRAIESHLARIVDENARSRTALAEELRGLIERLAGPASEDERAALMTHQRAIESHLGRLVDENVRSRTALADELRGEFRLLARTIASTRGAVQPPGES